MSRLTLAVSIASSAVACGACSGSSDRESEPPAPRSAIAFVRGEGEELVVVDPDGGNERVLVEGTPGRQLAGFERVFSWSPNGRQLLYSVEAPVDTGDTDDYYVDVYVVDADGSDRRKLRRANISTDLVWSPRGDAVLIGDIHVAGFRELVLVNADGSGARTIRVSDDIQNVAWSPDGKKIAYDTADADSVYVMNADGSAPKRLTDGFLPEWTPGGQIMFRFALETWLVNPDGSGLRSAGRVGLLWEGGELAPNGRTIAWWKDFGGPDDELALGDIGGGPLKKLTDNEMEDYGPSWSPDGKSLVFVRYREGPEDIWVINADGTGERNLTHSAEREFDPAWAPKP